VNAASAERHPDAVGALAEVLSAIDAEGRRQHKRLADNEHNRIGLLVIHALVALAVPPFFVYTSFTGPTWEAIRELPGFPYTFITPMWVGGMILLPATFARRQVAEIVGLALIYVWYMAMAVGFSVPVVTYMYASVRGHEPTAKPSLYAPLVYFHLAIIMRVHITTLRRFRRDHRRDRDILASTQAGLL
jgi:hypothetical protein